MKPLYVFILCSIILAALAMALPDLLLSPGQLLKGHEKPETSCLSCHQPFGGATSDRCMSCHKPDDIGIRSVAGNPIPADSGKAPFHRALAGKSCTGCHSDHRGAKAALALKTFRHEDLPSDFSNRCISCHRTEKPNDNLHLNAATASCGACHGTKQWKPATFDHNRYFPLDRDHRASCRTCHPGPSGYKTYTCYNCHEHSPANIAGEHREEGIYRYDNCIKCHRGGKSGNHDD